MIVATPAAGKDCPNDAVSYPSLAFSPAMDVTMFHRIVLDLLIRVPPARRASLIAFLERAVPIYEEPGGIRVALLADRSTRRG